MATATPPDPLANIIFISIPAGLLPSLSPSLDPGMTIPLEQIGPVTASSTITIEAIIAGMLRVLIYNPAHEHADSYAKIVKELRPKIKEEFTAAGTLKAKMADFPVAIEVFRALTALFPDCAVCAFNLALAYHDAARHCEKNEEQKNLYTEEAFQAYQRALAHDAALPDIHVNYGHFLLEQENYEKALAHFEAYLHQEEDNNKRAAVVKIVASLSRIMTQDSLFKEAFDFISLGREEEGITKVNELLKKNPEFWNGWFLLGWAQRRLARYSEAKESFLKALSLDVPKPDLLNELAIVHMELGEYDDSCRCLRDALKLEPENTKVLSNLGIVSIKMGRSDDAKGFFHTVLEFSPEDQIANNFLETL
jgi:tetratricopeptide (TPR) repeat protein